MRKSFVRALNTGTIETFIHYFFLLSIVKIKCERFFYLFWQVEYNSEHFVDLSFCRFIWRQRIGRRKCHQWRENMGSTRGRHKRVVVLSTSGKLKKLFLKSVQCQRCINWMQQFVLNGWFYCLHKKLKALSFTVPRSSNSITCSSCILLSFYRH